MHVRFHLSVLVGALLLIGCASLDVADRISEAERIAAAHDFSKASIRTDRFDLTAFVGPQKRRGELHVYIEGDGFAWVTRYQPSKNPTPINPVALKLAVLDGYDTAYLGRPCQYVALPERTCQERYWTSGRFAPEIIDAMDEAITRLKRDSGDARLVLIGYSGGGTIAALVAARRTDVIHLITVAGNLDPDEWARLHGVPALSVSLNPVNYVSTLAGIRQTHFIGEQDRIVPINIYRSYRRAFPEQANVRMTIVPHVDHSCCWETVWPHLLQELR